MIFDYLSKFGPVKSPEYEYPVELKSLPFKYLGLYFTATWCSSCVRSSSGLKKIIQKINQKHPDQLKLITIRLDESTSNFGYNFLRISQLTYQQAGQLSQSLAVRFLPSILVYNKNGQMVSATGFHDLFSHKQNTLEYWDSIIH